MNPRVRHSTLLYCSLIEVIANPPRFSKKRYNTVVRSAPEKCETHVDLKKNNRYKKV